MKFIKEKLEKAFTELERQERFRMTANAFGSTFTFFAETQSKSLKGSFQFRYKGIKKLSLIC